MPRRWLATRAAQRHPRSLPAMLLPALAALASISCVFSPLAWSPDSGRLAYVTASSSSGQLTDPHELQILDVATGRAQTLLRSDGFLGPPAYSRDGIWIAMLETELLRNDAGAAASRPDGPTATSPAQDMGEQRRRLYLRLVSAADGATRRWPVGMFPQDADRNDAADALLLVGPAFAPDGKQVYCHAPSAEENGEQTWAVLAVELETGELRQVATGAQYPLLSSDGTLLAAWVAPAISATLPASAPAIAGSGRERWVQLALVPTEGGSLRRVDVFRRMGEPPLAAWAASGRQLVVWGRRAESTAGQLLLVRPGKAPAALPWPGDRPTAPPAAMPDGRMLLLQRTDVPAPPSRPATDAAVPAAQAAPDGGRTLNWRVDLVAMSLSQGRSELFATGPTGVHRGCVAVSPDGKWIALRESLAGEDASDLQRSAIRLLDSKGRDVRTVEIRPGTRAEP